MRNKRILSLLLSTGMLFSTGTTAFASSIEELQAEKEAAEAGYAQTQSAINSLESKKQELENYLAQLNAQYEELTGSVADLGIQAAQKEEALKKIQTELAKARNAAEEQYAAMKIRIAYMYEKGGSGMLEMLLSAQDLSEFLNRAANVAAISEYDREMLQKYENLMKQIEEQEKKVEQEMTSINTLMNQRSAKKQEVQSLVASTNESIVSYVNQISASQAEADALMSEISSADSNLASMMQQVETSAGALDQESFEGQEIEVQEENYDYDASEDTMDSSSSSTSTEVVVESVEEEYSQEYSEEVVSEEYYEEESYEEEYYEEPAEESSSDSGQGTYLGNFTLTAYCNCAQCCGTAGNLTASGTVPAAGHTVAMAGVPFGTQLSINGSIYTVEDLGTPYGHVDIFFDNHADALNFGLQYADVYQIG
jgi:peptidoglycan hydrolase CwlO-like protein/3D (Asp-Asp-Asp) domain-containing protein